MWRVFVRGHWRAYAAGIVLLVAGVYAQTLAPVVLGDAIDALAAPEIDAAFVGRCAVYIVIIGLAAFLLRFAWRYLIIGGSRHFERSLRQALCEKLQMMPVSFYHRQRSGDLMAYAINDIGAVRMAFGPGLAHLLTGISTTVFSLLSMTGVVHKGLTLAALAPIPFAVLGVFSIGGIVRKRFEKVQSQFAQLSGHVNENIMGMRVIKTFVREEVQEKRYDAESNEMMRLNVHLVRVSAATGPLTQFLFGISFAVGIIYGGSLVKAGQITMGNFATFHAYLLMIMSPIVAMGRVVNLLQRGRASMKRLDAIFAEPDIAEREMQTNPAAEPSDRGGNSKMLGDNSLSQEILNDIEARGLSFRYSGAKRNALTDVSFRLRKGETLGIVGPTGSGKSTLLSLIMKFYDAPEGMLYIGGQDIASVPARAIRDRAGYVPQEGFLFSGTLAENIVFFQPNTDEASILRAVEQAGLLSDLAQLPLGLETRVGERGAHISGGQRQRTALARALIREPALLLLDDTLSAVDTLTERVVLDSLEAYHRQRSTIIVSHKLSAALHADEILYLEKGCVLERGTHAQLLARQGAYAALWSQQQNEEGPIR